MEIMKIFEEQILGEKKEQFEAYRALILEYNKR